MKQRPFYCSHDTEKAPGHSFSTAEEEHMRSKDNKENEFKMKLNGSNEYGKQRMFQPSKQQEQIIKVTQILNNNNMNNNKRYNLAVTPDCVQMVNPHLNNAKTPKAIPYFSKQTSKANPLIKVSIPNDDDKTQRKGTSPHMS